MITVLAYLFDRLFGEFRFIRHPIMFIGDCITFFEKNFYKDSVTRGAFLVVFIVGVVFTVGELLLYLLELLPFWLYTLVTSLIASMFVAHAMLRESVAAVLSAEDKHYAVSMLVSRDTHNLSESEIYKAAIESYAENLSDGVVAPLLYLALFNLPGIMIYKAINTMDSMVGYRTPRYEKFGKCAAKLDDVVNFIPSRLTALLIMLRAKRKNLLAFYTEGSKHESPNAGHPITAMALALGVKLGGDTSYFGKIKKKPYFGKGREQITQDDVKNALSLL